METVVTAAFYSNFLLVIYLGILRYGIGLRRYHNFGKPLEKSHPAAIILLGGIVTCWMIVSLGLAVASLWGTYPYACYGIFLWALTMAISVFNAIDLQILEEEWYAKTVAPPTSEQWSGFMNTLDKNLEAGRQELRELSKAESSQRGPDGIPGQ